MTIEAYFKVLTVYRKCLDEMKADPKASAELMTCFYGLGMQRICEALLDEVVCVDEAQAEFLKLLERERESTFPEEYLKHPIFE